jgi:hypothetical protein
VRRLDFMIVGVQKAGTTALANFLSEHPAISIAEGKEVHLFDSPDFRSSWSAEKINSIYAPYFQNKEEKKLLGEATPIYIFFDEIPAFLASYNPGLKLILLLRNPANRAISQYWMERKRGDESYPMFLAILLEPLRLLWERYFRDKRDPKSHYRTHSYISRGHYTAQINNLLKHFSVEQLLVVDNDALLSGHDNTMREVLEFLGAEIGHIPAQQNVFSGSYSRKSNVVIKWCLDFYFRSECKRLRKLLLKLNHVGDWRWLGGVTKM